MSKLENTTEITLGYTLAHSSFDEIQLCSYAALLNAMQIVAHRQKHPQTATMKILKKKIPPANNPNE